MKTFSEKYDWICQGDVRIDRVKSIPKDAKLVQSKGNYEVVTHSETGHDHVFKRREGIQLFETSNPLVGYLQIAPAATDGAGAVLEHLRGWDTHASITFTPGCYQIRRQREFSPEGWRRVAD